jgi:hypothetical protein
MAWHAENTARIFVIMVDICTPSAYLVWVVVRMNEYKA